MQERGIRFSAHARSVTVWLAPVIWLLPVSVKADSPSVEQLLRLMPTQTRLPWEQIFEEGGLDSRPAIELGVFTVPTMILLDKEGRVVNRNVQVVTLDREVRRLTQ